LGEWVTGSLNLVGLAGLATCLVPRADRRLKAAGAVLAVLAAGLLVRSGQVTALQQLLNGLFLGSIYALIALGYTMVYGVLKLINFAHGEVFMVGALLGYAVFTVLRDMPALALVVALLVAMVGCALLGVVIERAAYRPLRTAPRLAALITAIGVSLLLQNLVLLIVGASPKTIPPVIPTTTLRGLELHTGLSVNLPQVITALAAAGLMVGLQLLVAHTKIGRAMRAVSEDREAARLMGINVDLVIAATFVIGSALAGAGGVLYGLRVPVVKFDMGVLPGLKAFVAAVLGGIGSIRGATIGALLIGVVEVAVQGTTLSPVTLTHVVLLLVMLVAFWRLGQHELHERLPRTAQGNALRALIGTAVAAGCVVVSGVAATHVARWLGLRDLATLSGSTFQDAAVFSILVVILIVKPTGLMGRYAPEKV
jgi:branched-chain amino acid transport system permease protein